MDQTAARLAIHELVATYDMAWDTGDADGVVATFVADGVFVDAAGGAHVGRGALHDFVAASPGQFGAMRHITSTHLVEFTGETAARHRCYVVFVSHPHGERTLDTGGYDDEVVLTDRGWRFARRTVSFD
ncbi:nuclear transport factor 2 family protein [Nocardioides halotolerans]|uniref:nuclear transport factor 2 family protein n=1 Tax=Nocardioides halotolerans TaxID=433660 RepID=UPI0004162AE4|nr:nuclear transport factor 2 family protein [Nocardioides halotolerans]